MIHIKNYCFMDSISEQYNIHIYIFITHVYLFAIVYAKTVQCFHLVKNITLIKKVHELTESVVALSKQNMYIEIFYNI